ncbi:LysR family transcriptional regulator [Roseibium porphyridii]|uniref:LysR family transcriptional regulator n=1 Tax=Roseibium porphyridii TaxID=2866279 RepID=A0ABY8F928_9HYPH|nr:LysR family transcriptional regulator [Roseibium sp. KMA01]WFE91904.1 LysR family transcriptional regulator [Roseibium sp. KMA01]
MIDRALDIDCVRAFVRIAELGSFTRAADMARMTQSAMSLKLKRLEERLDCKLVQRTPRHVELTARGAAFLVHARELLEVHDRAFTTLAEPRQKLTIGLSDHVAGPELPALVARMNAQDPQLTIEIRIGSSLDLLKDYDLRLLDAAIVRFDKGRDGGQTIANEKFSWFASQNWRPSEDEPLPIATMPEPCGVRSLAGELLDRAGIEWREVFVGGGVTAVSAAVVAGMGVSALSRRMLPLGVVDVGPRLGLPALPALPVILHTRIKNGRHSDTLNALTSAFKSAI